jgi:DNA-binding NarL/FixJ family response regulator
MFMNRPVGLTHRETEVIALVAAGRANKEIARQLVISQATVKAHISIAMAKLGARGRTGAAVTALRRGLIA